MVNYMKNRKIPIAQQAIENVESEDFIQRIPIVLEEMYMNLFATKYMGRKEPIVKYPEAHELYEDLMVRFCSGIVKQYYKHVYGVDLTFEPSDETVLQYATCAYNPQTDKILYNPTVFELNHVKHASYLVSLLHEARHKVQYDAFKTGDINRILEYDPTMMLQAKEYAFEQNQMAEGNISFGIDNYPMLFTELDAESNALETIGKIVDKFLGLYENYCKENNIEYDTSLKYKFAHLIRLLAAEFSINYHKDINRGLVHPFYMSELKCASTWVSKYDLYCDKVDRLVELDKFIRENPELREKYPILDLIINGDYTKKSYNQIIRERDTLLERKGETYRDKIMQLYRVIIFSDPIYCLNYFVDENRFSSVEYFVTHHERVLTEYTDEVENIVFNAKDEKIKKFLERSLAKTKK